MNIVVVSTQFPLPARDGASLRVLNLVRQLAQTHQVTFCALAGKDDAAPRDIEELRTVCQAVHVVAHRRPSWKKLWQMGTAPLRRDPYLVVIYRSRALRRLVSQLAPRADVVQAEFPYGGQYFLGLPCRKVLDAHNIETDILRLQYPRERHALRRASSYLQWRKMALFEERVCRAADAVLATSTADRAKILALNPNTFLVPNGVNYPPTSVAGSDDSGTITFTGLMSYPANEDAVLYFVESIWPHVRGRGRRLMIVGNRPTRAVSQLHRGDVTVTGAVPEIAPYLARASVLVAPLRIGSGTRIKILQAMAHGVPVVSTSIGCMGLGVSHDEHLLVADRPQEFAACVNRLLEDGALRRRLGAAGRAFVAQSYTWDAIGVALRRIYERWA